MYSSFVETASVLYRIQLLYVNDKNSLLEENNQSGLQRSITRITVNIMKVMIFL